MNNAHSVGLGQRIGNLRCKTDGLLRRQGSLAQTMLERLSLDQFHDEKVHGILMTDVMESADVRMREFRNRFRFALQPLP